MDKTYTPVVRRFLLTGILLLLLPVESATAQIIKVTVNTVPQKNELLRSIAGSGDYSGDYYVSAQQFARILNAPISKQDILKKIVLYIEGTEVTLTSDNPFVTIRDNIYQMPLEVREYRSDIYFPARELITLLNRHLPGRYVFDSVQRVLEISYGDEINITGLYVEEKANGTLVHITTSKYFGNDLNYWFDESKYNLTVEFYTGRLDTVLMSSTETRGLVLRNTAVQHSEIASITFRLSRYVEDTDVTQNAREGEVLISLIRKNAAPSLTDYPMEIQDLDVNEIVAKEREAWMVNTVVIDPGHGGKDPGTMSKDGLKEKDIVLDIARYLGNLVEKSNLVENVIFTRNSDVFVPLKKRAEIANNSEGKLFISIHVNSNNNSNLRGYETYFLHPGKNQEALEVLEVVQRENNVMNLYEDYDPSREFTEEDFMILSITQNAFTKESEQLAHFISEGIEQKVNWPNKGVKQAGFMVLWGVSMPNVLVEAGFITNTGQRRDLRSSTIKHRIAEGIFEGIKKFIDEVRS